MNNNRIVYIDNIRSLLIILVVIIHVSVTYSGIGGWYYTEFKVDDLNILQKVIIALFNGFTQSYFMGFMFLIAGYFVPNAYDKRGFKKFLKGRFVRLAIPALLYVFIINPLIIYLLLGDYYGFSNLTFFDNYKNYITNLHFLSGTGPLWFVVALLIFSFIYALFRILNIRMPKFNILNKINKSIIIVILIVITTFFTFIIRLFYPFGTDFYNFQLCFFAQYIVLFIAGVITYRLKLLDNICYKYGIKWFKYGILVSLLFFVCLLYFGGAIDGKEDLLFGGFHIQAVGYALWESITCASVILGIIVIFRDRFNKHNHFSKLISDNSFGIYVLHAPVLISISLIFKNLNLDPLSKTLFVIVLTLPIVFVLTYLIRKIKPLKLILS